MSSNFQEWSREVDAQIGAVPDKGPELLRALALLALGAAVRMPDGSYQRLAGVVLLTPVDEGLLRSAWNVSLGSPDRSEPGPSARVAPEQIVAAAQRELSRVPPYSTVWITNPLVYASIVEFGGYPVPVIRGTWDRKLRRYVIRSAGGYSKQAPRGMVRITVRELERILAAAEVN